MVAIIYLLGTFIADLLKSRRRLEVENLFLRHQLNIILRRPPQRLRLRGSDRAPWTAIAELADIPAQPCGRDCGDRSVRGSNPDLRAAVCLSCCRPWTAATAVVCGDPQSVGGMAGSTDGRGIPLEHGAHLFGARQ